MEKSKRCATLLDDDAERSHNGKHRRRPPQSHNKIRHRFIIVVAVWIAVASSLFLRAFTAPTTIFAIPLLHSPP
ncbi:unnamed protein product [Linum tenue]|uniref:Transmembrane protein n=1 Tax=Linum tenue TaxID=586396 RepID=A0AAV0RLH8_9ROSI|nr:unnamed protein product [Linum tenue]CAI0558435.1 unnamed protein product [Linum tenue]